MNLPYADECPCFKTGSASPDTWIDKCKNEIKKANGVIGLTCFGSEAMTGRSAFLISFSLGEDAFKITWPVLPCKKEADERAAKLQAATLLYHDIKAKCVKARIFGMRTAFFEHLLLPDGREARFAATPDLEGFLPDFARPRLTDGR